MLINSMKSLNFQKFARSFSSTTSKALAQPISGKPPHMKKFQIYRWVSICIRIVERNDFLMICVHRTQISLLKNHACKHMKST